MRVHLVVPLGLLCGLVAGCTGPTKNVYRDEQHQTEIRLDLVSEGYVLPVIEYRGRSYVEGIPGTNYVLRIRNNSSRRIEVVAAVDGRDVVDGEPMDTDKRGYIVNPDDQVIIEGWRTSMNSVAAFRFSSPEESYSARMGTPREVGKIEVAVFMGKRHHGPLQVTEKDLFPDEQPPSLLDSMNDEEIPSSPRRPESRRRKGPGAKSNLGTLFGEGLSSRVREVEFERESSRPAFWLGLIYDDAQGLCERGIREVCGGDHGPLLPVRHGSESPPERRFAEPPP